MGGLTYKKFFKYVFITLIFICFNKILNEEPLSLSLLPGLFYCGTNPIITLALFFIVSFCCFNFKTAIAIAFSAVCLCVIFCIYRKKNKALRFEIILYILLSLLPYYFGINSELFLQKAVYSVVICILSVVSIQGVDLVFIKRFNKKASKQQVIALYVDTVFFAFGLINFTSLATVYVIATFALLLFCYFYKNARAYTMALVLSLPLALYTKQSSAIAVFVIYCAVVILFIERSKLLSAISAIAVQSAYLFLTGGFSLTAASIALHFLPFALFLFLPTKLLKYLESMVKKFDEPQIIKEIINDERAELSANLYYLSSVFSNLNGAVSNFNKLPLTTEQLIEKICDEIIFTVCVDCAFRDKCYKKNKPDRADVIKLINIGINKGNVSLIDLSKNFSSYCYSTNNVIFAINKLLDEYRLHVEKSESVNKCAELVAVQSNAVSEVLKNLAFDFSTKIDFNRKAEIETFDYLAREGVLLNQILKVGDSYHLLFFDDKNDFSLCGKLLSAKTQKNMHMVCKTDVGDGILAKYSPSATFDACFGIAQQTKFESEESGDTHSLTKIDESNFFVALCDGMGSGKTAFLNSQTAISLIEAFLRAKISKKSCFDLTNKMLSLCSNESFCALDLICVDLENGQADIFKIGGSFGFYISNGNVKVIENNALPLGIMDEISPTYYSVKLNDGDIFILLSDGITDAFFSSSDAIDFLQSEKCTNPQTLAEKILNFALTTDNGKAKDDMTAIAVKIYKRNFI